jgi:hypothetical protein
MEREPVEKPMPRITEADQKNDTKSLNRALQRTLYLLVKNKEGQWQFPQDRLKEENLHGVRSTTARRDFDRMLTTYRRQTASSHILVAST